MNNKKYGISLLIGVICIVASVLWMIISKSSTGYFLILTAIGSWLVVGGIIGLKTKK